MNAATPPGSDLTRRQRLVWTLQVFVILTLVWMLLNGLSGWWAGLLAAASGALMGGFLAPGHPHPWRPHRLIGFVAFFLWESLKGGMDVAWRAVQPNMPIKPFFTRHRLGLPAGQPRTLMVAVVSLLPGTLGADLEDDGDTLLVHALMPGAEDSVGRLEQWLAWMFSVSSESG